MASQQHTLAPPMLQVNTHLGPNNDVEDARTPSRQSTVSNPFLSPTPTNTNPFLTPSNRSRASSVATTLKPEDALRPDPGTEGDFVVENNPFAFSPGHLNKLIDPKSLQAFKALGGLRGIEQGLQTDIHTGLSVDEKSPRRRVTLEEATQNIKHEASTEYNGERPEAFSDRIRVYGKNVLPAKKATSLWRLMWNAYNDKVILVLTGAAVISLSLGLYGTLGRPHPPGSPPPVDWVEGVAICIAIIIVTVVGSLNDWQKERAFVKLNEKKEDREIKVIRSGRSYMINVHDVLVGDVLHLEPGDLIPVDGIFIGGHDLRCDESSITGESDAIKKTGGQQVMDILESGRPAHNLDPFIVSGAKVLEGVGTFVCTSVGVHSSFGKIMMSVRTDIESTPLQAKLERLAVAIAKLGTGAAVFLFFILFFRFLAGLSTNNKVPAEKATEFTDILIVAITIVVVAVPEGLPLAVTLALAFATKRLLKENNLVRVLRSCETMGNATTICTDKTGTLTTNKMTVVAGTFGSTSFDKPDNKEPGTQTVSQWASGLTAATKEAIIQSVAINSTAFEGDEDGQSTFIGSKTETAFLTLAKEHLGMQSLSQVRANEQVVQMMPFDSSKKCMGAVVKRHTGEYRLLIKGASEILLECCTSKVVTTNLVSTELTTSVLSESDVGVLSNTINTYARKSLRTISLVYRDFSQWPPAEITTTDGYVDLASVLNNLVFLGLVGIQDPVRPGVPEAVKKAQFAGVVVRMVTGDNVVTAQAIAAECGIYSDGIIMEGPVFRRLNDEEMDQTLPRLQVLARSSPEDKRILVMRLKERGETVAVTGDGTNDAPALKAADVGFSMGISGTEVAKEASSIVLMDDNFASIIVALKWGRAVNDAVQKFLQFQITVNITAVLLAFISSVSDPEMKSVLTAVQLLWLNLIMDTFAALALATDPPTEKILDRPPQPKSAPLITINMWKMIIGQAMFQLATTLILHYAGRQILNYSDLVVDTMVFNTFVWMQIFNEFNNRRLDNKFNIFEGVHRNKFFIGINCGMVGAQIAIIFVGGAAFSITSINGTQWAICLLLAVISLPWAVVVRLCPDIWYEKVAGVVGRPVVVVYRALGSVFSRIGQMLRGLKREKATATEGDVEAPRDSETPVAVVSEGVIPSIQIGSASDDERGRI
ncbi:Calcium-transporting ATPase 2 [Apiospora aurea]|uniref:Calcium-transporting ATPase n=1 Tax=Apiospora aurea TaxID=335848 RepID=A0ABR1QJ05_9PEZI